jgi:predicted  nucleic acid-binding Zn-ribbon protein
MKNQVIKHIENEIKLKEDLIKNIWDRNRISLLKREIKEAKERIQKLKEVKA